MANGDGWCILRELRAHNAQIPIILISSTAPDRPADYPTELVFSAYMLKPLDHRELLDCLGELLQLEWQITSAETLTKEPPVDISSFLDAETLEELRVLVKTGQITEIMTWAESLSKSDPQYRVFAERLYNAARNIDVAELLEMTNDPNSFRPAFGSTGRGWPKAG
jgi:CheY-like chemotaxis protein